MTEGKERFYKWLNRERPNTSLRPLQKAIVYIYLLINDEEERTEVMNLLDDYEEHISRN
jgi:hypothetical protein